MARSLCLIVLLLLMQPAWSEGDAEFLGYETYPTIGVTRLSA